jgi:hypothetical protein
MDPLTAKDIFTISCAVIGAVLGIINTWNGLNQRRVKLKVVPKIAYPVSHAGDIGPEMGCIEVTNLSAFPVTVRDIGFTIDGDPRKKTRAAILEPLVQDGGPWPRRLEARASVSLYFDWSHLKRDIRKAYALTDCGEVAYGNSPALKSMRKKLSA